MKWTRSILLTFLFLLASCAPAKLQWTTFTTKDGLIYDRVSSVAVAPGGAVWFGTGTGISRFDGKNWTSYTEKDGVPHSGVESIAITSDGTVWVGATYDVARFDGKSWITYHDQAIHGISLADVRSIAVQPNGTIWFGMRYNEIPDSNYRFSGGIVRFDGTNWEALIPNASISSMAFDSSGVLWIGTLEQGIQRFDGTTWTTYTQTETYANDVNSIAIDSHDVIWAATESGVSRFDGKNWSNYTVAEGLPSNEILSIATTPNGVVWVGTRDAGVACFDGRKWNAFTTADGLASNRVDAIATAPNDTIWFAHWGNGVSRASGGCVSK